MSKLQGNERWNSKLLLTEHHEQYDKEHPAAPFQRSGHPTPEELTMVRDFILLPHMLTIVQRSVEDIQLSSNPIERLYVLSANVLMHRINDDMRTLRQELNRRRIKLMNQEQVDLVVYHTFMCRGYEERFGIVREVMKAEISVRLTKYIGEIGRFMKGMTHPLEQTATPQRST